MTDNDSIKTTQRSVLLAHPDMDKCSYFVKALATITCLVCFFANNFVILQQFISRKTILASHYRMEKELYFPSIVVCNFSAYKKSEMTTMDLDDYLENTFNLFDTLDLVSIRFFNNSENVLYNETHHSEDLKIESIYTFFRGRCYKFQYNKKVIIVLYNILLDRNFLYSNE